MSKGLKGRLMDILFEVEYELDSDNLEDKIIVGNNIYELKKELTEEDKDFIEEEKLKLENTSYEKIFPTGKMIILGMFVVWLLLFLPVISLDRIRSFNDILFLFYTYDLIIPHVSFITMFHFILLFFVGYEMMRDLKKINNAEYKFNTFDVLKYILVLVLSLVISITAVSYSFAFNKVLNVVLTVIVTGVYFVYNRMLSKEMNSLLEIKKGLI